MFRDNGQSLGHAFAKAIEMHGSEKIDGWEHRFFDTFPPPEKSNFFLKCSPELSIGYYVTNSKMRFSDFWTSSHRFAIISSNIDVME